VFDSVVDALSAAISIQDALAEKNRPVPDAQQLRFRIGLNLGDIIVDGDDIFGNGVNVAARVEALADAGGIAVTSAVRDQIGNKLPLHFEDRGTHRVKNIEVPLHVYAVQKSPGGRAKGRPRKSLRGVIIAGMALMVLTAITAGLWFLSSEPLRTTQAKPTTAAQSPVAPVESTRPTIAVLPFENRGGQSEQSYFSDGVTEDVIAALGRFSGLLVLSWSAVEPLKNPKGSALERATDLGASYVVSGSVQRSEDKIRLSVQLSEAKTGVLIWSDRYDEDILDLFGVQDRFTRQIVAALAVRVTQVEEARVAVAPTNSLTAYDLVLRGRDIMREISLKANDEARGLFERAIEMDENYAMAFAELGFTHLNELKFGWTQWPQRAWEAAQANADQAIKLDPFNSRAYSLKAAILKYAGQLSEAERLIDKALSLNPNNAQSHAERCSILMFSGKSEEALGASEMAMAIDPYPRADEINCPIFSLYVTGQFEKVINLAERFPLVSKEEATSLFVRAAAHAMLDQDAKAEKLVAEGFSRYPFFNATNFANIFSSEEQRRILLEGMRKAGIK
jgi:TolB-like protein